MELTRLDKPTKPVKVWLQPLMVNYTFCIAFCFLLRAIEAKGFKLKDGFYNNNNENKK